MIVLVAVVLGSVLTVAYGAAAAGGGRSRPSPPWCRKRSASPRAGHLDPRGRPRQADPPPSRTRRCCSCWPAMILAVLGLAVALLPQLGETCWRRTRTPTPRASPGTWRCGPASRPPLYLTLAILRPARCCSSIRDRVERWQSGRVPRARGGPGLPAVHAAARRRRGRRDRGHPARFAAPVPRPDPAGVRRGGRRHGAGGGGVADRRWRWWDSPAQAVFAAGVIASALLVTAGPVVG